MIFDDFSLDITCENEGCNTLVKLEVLANHLTDCAYNKTKTIQCENGCGMMISNENLIVRFFY